MRPVYQEPNDGNDTKKLLRLGTDRPRCASCRTDDFRQLCSVHDARGRRRILCRNCRAKHKRLSAAAAARKRRQFAADGYEQPACVVCGEPALQLLERDHLTGAANSGSTEPLCANHHAIKSYMAEHGLMAALRLRDPERSALLLQAAFEFGLGAMLGMFAVGTARTERRHAASSWVASVLLFAWAAWNVSADCVLRGCTGTGLRSRDRGGGAAMIRREAPRARRRPNGLRRARPQASAPSELVAMAAQPPISRRRTGILAVDTAIRAWVEPHKAHSASTVSRRPLRGVRSPTAIAFWSSTRKPRPTRRSGSSSGSFASTSVDRLIEEGLIVTDLLDYEQMMTLDRIRGDNATCRSTAASASWKKCSTRRFTSDGTLCVGFNLPFDLTRIAVHAGIGRGENRRKFRLVTFEAHSLARFTH